MKTSERINTNLVSRNLKDYLKINAFIYLNGAVVPSSKIVSLLVIVISNIELQQYIDRKALRVGEKGEQRRKIEKLFL